MKKIALLFALALCCLVFVGEAQAHHPRPRSEVLILRAPRPRAEILILEERRRSDTNVTIRRGPFGGESIRVRSRR